MGQGSNNANQSPDIIIASFRSPVGPNPGQSQFLYLLPVLWLFSRIVGWPPPQQVESQIKLNIFKYNIQDERLTKKVYHKQNMYEKLNYLVILLYIYIYYTHIFSTSMSMHPHRIWTSLDLDSKPYLIMDVSESVWRLKKYMYR